MSSKNVAFALFVFVMGSSAASAPAAERGPAPRLPQSVAGSTWHFCGMAGESVTFEPGGAATFRKDKKVNAEGLACGGARWTQDGAHLAFDCAGVTQYRVSVAPSAMQGEWHRTAHPSEKFPTCLQPGP